MDIIIFTGNVGKDAEVKTFGTRLVVSFNVAVSEGKKNADGTWSNDTSWRNCSRWYDNAEFANRFAASMKKGSGVIVEGKPRIRTYQDASGATKAAMEVTVDKVEVIRRQPDGNAESGGDGGGMQPNTSFETQGYHHGGDNSFVPQPPGGDLPF